MIRLKPAEARGYVERARLEDKSGETKTALSNYGQAIKLEPKSYVALLERASLNARTKAYKEAANDYSKIVELMKTEGPQESQHDLGVSTYQERAQMLEILGDKKGAQQDRGKAAELKANAPPQQPH